MSAPQFVNSYARLPEAFHAPAAPSPAPKPDQLAPTEHEVVTATFCGT